MKTTRESSRRMNATVTVTAQLVEKRENNLESIIAAETDLSVPDPKKKKRKKRERGLSLIHI